MCVLAYNDEGGEIKTMTTHQIELVPTQMRLWQLYEVLPRYKPGQPIEGLTLETLLSRVQTSVSEFKNFLTGANIDQFAGVFEHNKTYCSMEKLDLHKCIEQILLQVISGKFEAAKIKAGLTVTDLLSVSAELNQIDAIYGHNEVMFALMHIAEMVESKYVLSAERIKKATALRILCTQ